MKFHIKMNVLCKNKCIPFKRLSFVSYMVRAGSHSCLPEFNPSLATC